MTPVRHPVRPARPAEFDAIERLQALLAEPSPSLLAAAFDERSTTSVESVESVDENSQTAESPTGRTFRLFVSPDETDAPVGYLLAIEGTETHVAELAVDPQHRREGRARVLLAATIDASEPPLTVNVAADNAAARALYRSVGFTEESRSAGRFESGDGLTLRYEK